MLLQAVPCPAGAQSGEERRARLLYAPDDGVAGCPERESVESLVSARLGYVPWEPAAKRVLAVSVRRAGGGLVARVEVLGPGGRAEGSREHGSRSLDCGALMARVTLSLSILIDPLSVAGPAPRPERLPAPAPAPPARPPPRAVATPPPEPKSVAKAAQPEEPTPWELSAAIGGTVLFGVAPAVTGGFDLHVRLRRRMVSLALEGRADLPAEADVGGPALGTQVFAGAIVPCLHLWWASGCAVVLAGGLRVSERGLVDARPVTLPYAAAGGRLQLEVPIFRMLAVRVHGDLLATLTRITLEESGSGEALWRTPPISGALGVGLSARFF